MLHYIGLELGACDAETQSCVDQNLSILHTDGDISADPLWRGRDTDS
jgi:hypothetical protein